MDDREFFDLLYQQWAKTTWAENAYWMYEAYLNDGVERSLVYAISENDRKLIASFEQDEDADFITAVHGCLPDLIRRLQDSLDEADRLDVEKDELIGRVAELEMEADELNARLLSYSERIKEEESFSEGLINDNLNMERWLDNGGTV